MEPRDVRVGMSVTVKFPVRTHNGTSITPGQVCKVDSVGVPKVRIVQGEGRDGRDVFVVLVDSAGERAGVNYCNLLLWREPEKGVVMDPDQALEKAKGGGKADYELSGGGYNGSSDGGGAFPGIG